MNQNQNMASNIDTAMGTMIGYFKTALSSDAKYQYLKQIGYIPKMAIDDISEIIISERRPTAANFPTIQEIKSHWYRWQQDHPGKVSQRNRSVIPCDSCLGSAILRFRRQIPITQDGIPLYSKSTQLSAWCGDCENWKRFVNNIEGDRRYTKQYILDNGWLIWPYQVMPKIKGGIKEMVDMVGKPVDKLTLSDKERLSRTEELKQQAAEITQEQEAIPF